MKYLVIILMLSFLGSCAKWDKTFSFNDKRTLVCYSGGKVIYKGASEGKVSSEDSSDGYIFHEQGSGDLMEVSGDCVMRSK